MCMGYPDNSASKESTCNEGDPGSIPGLGRSAGEGIDRLTTPGFLGFPCGLAGKECAENLPPSQLHPRGTGYVPIPLSLFFLFLLPCPFIWRLACILKVGGLLPALGVL